MSRKKKNNYWGEEQEQACIKYGLTESREERNYLYNTYLRKELNIMVESIIRRYPIYLGDSTIEDLEVEVLSHVIKSLGMFKPGTVNKEGKLTRAFSYYQTVVRNFCMNHSKEANKKRNALVDFDLMSEHVENMQDYQYELSDSTVDTEELYDTLFAKIIDNIQEKLDSGARLKPNDYNIGEALVMFFSNWRIVFAQELEEGIPFTNSYVKSKIQYFIRERSGLENKDIRTSMKTFLGEYEAAKAFVFDY